MPRLAGSYDRKGRAGGGRYGRSSEAARTPGQTEASRESDPASERRYWLVPIIPDAPQSDEEKTGSRGQRSG